MSLASKVREWAKTDSCIIPLVSLEKDGLPTYRAAFGHYRDIVSREKRFKSLPWEVTITQDNAFILPDDNGVLPFVDGWRVRIEYVSGDAPDELLNGPLLYTVRYESAGKVRLIPD